MRSLLSAGFAGFLFSLGLGLSGMTQPSKVQGFLDVTGDWNPALAFVMCGAVATYGLLRRWILRREKPVLTHTFPADGASRVDGRLLGGAALFGIGWGLSGYCPAPAVTSVSSGTTPLLFVASMLAGMGLFRIVTRNGQPAGQPRR